MKTYLIIILAFFIAHSSSGQTISVQPRALKVISNHDNHTIERLRKNRKGEIIRLEQITLEQRKDTLIRTAESYKKDKFWKIWTIRNIIHAEVDVIKEPEDYYVIKEVDDKMQDYDQDGKLMYESFIVEGVPKATYFRYYYYPNGNLKMIAEIKDEEILNILSFKNIDGTKHDYGNYKNGSGTIVWLNDKGEICTECFYEKLRVISEINYCDE